MLALFDSGFGGLTVLHEVRKLLPQYSYLYLGDNGRNPYGGRSQEIIYQYTTQAIDFLEKQGAKLIVIACNTASAEALRKIQQEYLPKHHPDLKVLGVLRPTIEVALEMSTSKKIGVVATRSTVQSEAYPREINKIDPNAKVYQQACPLLVPLIEEGWTEKPETKMILKKYLQHLKTCNIDTLILGCTHYPALQKDFERYMGKNVKIIPSSTPTAIKLQDYLARHPEIEKTLTQENKTKYFTSDDPARFTEIGNGIFQAGIQKGEVEKVVW